MLIGHQKWACEACNRGHRVTSCNHHDRPLIRIKRKGRPFATCSICNATPCETPTEHVRLKREAELESPSSKKSTHARLSPRHHSCKRFLPIAPRLSGSSGTAKDTPGTSSSARVSRSGSTSAASVSSFQTPVRGWQSSSRRTMVRGSVGKWPASEGSGNEPCGSSYALLSTSSPIAGLSVSAGPSRAGSSQSISHSGPDTVILDPAMGGDIIDTIYSLIPSSSVTGASLVQNAPVITLLEGTNPFDFPLDLGQRHDDGTLEYLDDMDLTEGITAEVFHVEGWSNYMWSPETGFEQVNTGYLAVSQ